MKNSSKGNDKYDLDYNEIQFEKIIGEGSLTMFFRC